MLPISVVEGMDSHEAVVLKVAASMMGCSPYALISPVPVDEVAHG